MKEFEYKVSVIVPVYNAGCFIRECLNSIIDQTINKSDLEVLLINDGSTDNSLDICKKYSEIYPYFKVYSKENEGASATRNFGLKHALGKYIFYLDSDDTISENTIEAVCNFFENHYDEVDLVTYLERSYLPNGTTRALHPRYKFLTKTGIYDLCQYPFLFQVHMNIVVKNRFDNNLLFDEEIIYHEDQKYCNDILKDKMKLGYVQGCEYQYKIHDSSVTGANTNPIILFEATTKYWEELFKHYEEGVPQYYQALYLHDLNWKMCQSCLFPYHYDKQNFEIACNRLWKLLEQIDLDMILKHPSLDNFHRYFFLEKKSNSHIMPIATEQEVLLVANEKVIFNRNIFELILNRCRTIGEDLLFQCTLKSQFFNFCEKPKVYAILNETEKIEVELFFSSMSYYKCKTITNNFYGFYFEYNMKKIKSLKFIVEVDGMLYETKYYNMPTSPFVLCNRIVRDKFLIELNNNKFFIKELRQNEIEEIEINNNNIIKKYSGDAQKVRTFSREYATKRIWLYYDCRGVECDNGYYQFCHDFEKNDGIDRYYVLNNDVESSRHLFTDIQWENVVMFGSDTHKEMFIRAEKIITAYVEEVNIYPFPANDKKLYRDIINFEVVYLQHGILHATLPWKYTPEKLELDRVVASSNFELENFEKKYCFRKQDIIPAGMPRFEKINRNKTAEKRIIFAPSWRGYLIGDCVETIWQLTPDKFLKSDYYKKFQEFLLSDELISLLEKYDYYLDFKIHPIFKPYNKYFTTKSERISLSETGTKDEDYALFITDFSSYTFNFAYLNRPIIYFVPDIMEFKAGLNQYRELDLPFEDAFGDFVQTVEEALVAVEKLISNKCKPEKKYLKRMQNFFLEIEDSTEKIYQSIVNKK